LQLEIDMPSERITIELETGNAAFDDSPTGEIARILRAMADRIEEVGMLPVPRDINGNVVGSVTIEPVSEET
jgi:hypothetical protein